jgi:xanthine dehydrogenase accessory factor
MFVVMKEFKEIITAYHNYTKADKKTALVSVVHLDGSSYRRPGARMLINDEGQLIGAISGGCLEGDALRKALLVISQQYSKLVTYDTSDEDDVSVGVQLGCAGIIQVLFEPVDASHKNNPIHLLEKVIAKRQKAILITLFSLADKNKPQTGTCLLIEEDGTTTGDISFLEIKETILADAKKVFEKKASSFINYLVNDQTITAFIEYIQPPMQLIVVGAGNDAFPMLSIGHTLGWEVSIVDGRNTHAKPERFAGACQVLVSKPEKVLEHIHIDEQTAFVLMTHNYNYDLAMLKILVEKNIRYIGMLGPKKKLDKMLEELNVEGIHLSEAQLDRIYGPTGLEIGAETAEEIALSIIAEIKAVFEGKQGTSLRNNKDFIHSRLFTQIENKKAL